METELHPHAHAPRPVSMHVDGMDCASCVGKIESALQRVPGVSEVHVNFATEQLDFTLEPGSATRAADVESLVKRLGFGVTTGPGSLRRSAAAPHTHDPAPRTEQRWWQTRKGRHVIGLGVLMGVAYALAFLLPVYGEWLLALAVVVGVFPFARQAIALARSGSPFSIETLMSVAALGALFIGEAEEAVAVVFLFSVGELLEGVAAGRARAGIRALTQLAPKTALLLDAQGGQQEVAAASLGIGDHILVRPGDRLPADGVVLHGASSVDESPITGESVPTAKSTGIAVYAGSINLDGVLQVRVETTAADNTLSRIIHLVEEAQAGKSPTARFIERFSRYYTPAVMAIAALIIVVPPVTLGADWGTWLYRGLALLLIACPCALVLSTPAAIASGLAAGARRGLLVKGGHALETMGQVRTIFFDKTGTLTEGKPRVTDVAAYTAQSEHEVLALAASVEWGSAHPLGKAIVGHAQAAGLTIAAASQGHATPGKAVHAVVSGRSLTLASPAHAAERITLTPTQRQGIEALQREGKTVSVLFDDTSSLAIGLVALRDEPRHDARQGLERLKSMGVRGVMLTGDNRVTAQAVSNLLGIDHVAELLPHDKLRLISEMSDGHKVAMVGDGINDAPALAAADVGIAMGGGTDVALETADAALLGSRVTDVAHLVALSRATMANIHQNVVFALGLKGLFLVTTAFGITGLWMAVLADTGATALVTLNALRLLRFKGSHTAD